MLDTIDIRLKKLREKMSEKDLDAVLVTKRENYFYLSGFTGTSASLIITQNEALLVTDFRYIEQATKQSPAYQIIKYAGELVDSLAQILSTRGIRKLGFEEMNMSCGKRWNWICKNRWKLCRKSKSTGQSC